MRKRRNRSCNSCAETALRKSDIHTPMQKHSDSLNKGPLSVIAILAQASFFLLLLTAFDNRALGQLKPEEVTFPSGKLQLHAHESRALIALLGEAKLHLR